jgi:hypothetical protein
MAHALWIAGWAENEPAGHRLMHFTDLAMGIPIQQTLAHAYRKALNSVRFDTISELGSALDIALHTQYTTDVPAVLSRDPNLRSTDQAKNQAAIQNGALYKCRVDTTVRPTCARYSGAHSGTRCFLLSLYRFSTPCT